MTRTQIISVIVALVISTSIASAAWWLVWSLATVSVPTGLALAVAVFCTWYSVGVAVNAMRREVWL